MKNCLFWILCCGFFSEETDNLLQGKKLAFFLGEEIGQPSGPSYGWETGWYFIQKKNSWSGLSLGAELQGGVRQSQDITWNIPLAGVIVGGYVYDMGGKIRGFLRGGAGLLRTNLETLNEFGEKTLLGVALGSLWKAEWGVGFHGGSFWSLELGLRGTRTSCRYKTNTWSGHFWEMSLAWILEVPNEK